MNERFERELIEALAALEAGQPIEQVLSQHAEEAEGLRPILQLANQLEQAPFQPSMAASSRSRHRFLAKAAALREGSETQRHPGIRRRLFFSFASVAVLLLLLGGALTAAARSALPGDTLYGVKLIVEDTRMALAQDTDGRLDLRDEFGRRRGNEALELLAAGREAEVVLGGDIESWENGVWTLNRDGLLLEAHLDSSTVISGTPKLGEYAHIEGRTVNGQFVADLVEISEDEAPEQDTHTP